MKSTLDADLASSLMTGLDGSGKTAGIAIGVRAGQAILQLRQSDGSGATPPAFVPGNAPGDYQLASPGFTQPVFTGWPAVTPFVLQRADQFRPGPPPSRATSTRTRSQKSSRSVRTTA
jgi:hypothetical protein